MTIQRDLQRRISRLETRAAVKLFREFGPKEFTKAARAFALERMGVLAKQGAYRDEDIWDFLEQDDRISNEDVRNADTGQDKELIAIMEKQLKPRIGKAMMKLGQKMINDSFKIRY